MRALSLAASVALLACGAGTPSRPLASGEVRSEPIDAPADVEAPTSPSVAVSGAADPETTSSDASIAPAERTGDSARWYAALHDDRLRRIADADRALAIATTDWLRRAHVEHFQASHDGYSYQIEGQTTLCAFGPREHGATERAPSRCVRHTAATEASVQRLRDSDGASLDAYCLVWTEEGRRFAARWAPDDIGTRGACPASVTPRGASPRDGAFEQRGEPSAVLEARPYLDATPLEGGHAVATPAIFCLRDDEWTCIEHDPLGDGVTAIAHWSPGVWIVHRHRSDGTTYWSETDDALLAISLDAGGVTIHARMWTGLDYAQREDESEPMTGGSVMHPHAFRGACFELGAPMRRGVARRGRLPAAPTRVNDEERELGDGAIGLTLDDRRGAWILVDGGFERIDACPDASDVTGSRM